MEIARQIIDRAIAQRCEYAVFVKNGTVEYTSAQGKRFAKMERSPEAMALCIGVYDGDADPRVLAADLAAAGVGQ